MKRIASALALYVALVWAAYAQIGITYFPGPGSPASAGGGGCSQATTWLSGKTTSFSSAYTTMICGLVTDGIFAKLDRLYVLATDNTTNALADIINNSAASITGSATFTANNGYVSSNGTLNSGANYTTTTNCKSTGCTLVAWTTGGSTQDNGCPIGEASGGFDTSLTPFGFSSTTGGAFFGISYSVSSASATGLFVANLVSGTITVYKNGVAQSPTASGSPSVPNTTMQGFECAGGTFYTENVGVIALGALSAGDQVNFYNRLHTFLNTVNATLYP